MNPNHASSFPREQLTPEQHSDDPFYVLDVDQLQDLRNIELALVEQEAKNVANDDLAGHEAARQRAYDKFPALRAEFLQGRLNMPPDSKRYDYFDKYLDNVSIDKMSESEWWAGEFDEDGNEVRPSGRQVVRHDHDELLNDFKEEASRARMNRLNPHDDTSTDGAHAASESRHSSFTAPDAGWQSPGPRHAAPDSSPDPNVNQNTAQNPDDTQRIPIFSNATNPNVVPLPQAPLEKDALTEQAFQQLQAARDSLAKLIARQRGRIRQGDKQDELLAEAQSQYNDALVSYGERLDRADAIRAGGTVNPNFTINDVRDDDAKNAFATDYLVEVASALRDEVNEKIESRPIRKILRWMTRGKIAERIAKNALTAEEAASLEREVEDTDLGGGIDLMHEQLEESIRTEQARRRKGVLLGLGTIALGAASAEAVHFIAQNVDLAATWEHVRDLILHKPSGGGSDTSGGVMHHPTMPHGPAHGGGDVLHPPVPGPETPIEHLTPQQLGAFEIPPGGSGIELAHNLGHGATEWFNIEGDLADKFPKDFYRMSDGHVGIAHPGALSEEATTYIAKAFGVWH